MGESTSVSTAPLVIGIDVGGPRKGFHAALVRGTEILARHRERDPAALAAWCAAQHAPVVAVDAPCRWRRPAPAPARTAERALSAAGIACYYSPTEERARSHPFYSWMLPGADLFTALQAHHPLLLTDATARPVSIETFPQAVACALAGTHVSARPADKRRVRSELLRAAGFALTGNESQDELDALLCALAATAFARGAFHAYGDAEDGFIVVPTAPLLASSPLTTSATL
jgi:predicted nuclease with RNAse H fold